MARSRRRRRREGLEAVSKYRWLSAPVGLAFGLGTILGLVVSATAAAFAFFAVAVFLVAFSISHVVGQRIRARRAARQ